MAFFLEHMENNKIRNIDTNEKLKEWIIKAIRHDIFTLFILNELKFSLSIDNSETATLGFDKLKGEFSLRFNKTFINNAGIKDIELVLKHELMHFINRHVFRGFIIEEVIKRNLGKNEEGSISIEQFYIATEILINGIICRFNGLDALELDVIKNTYPFFYKNAILFTPVLNNAGDYIDFSSFFKETSYGKKYEPDEENSAAKFTDINQFKEYLKKEMIYKMTAEKLAKHLDKEKCENKIPDWLKHLIEKFINVNNASSSEKEIIEVKEEQIRFLFDLACSRTEKGKEAGDVSFLYSQLLKLKLTNKKYRFQPAVAKIINSFNSLYKIVSSRKKVNKRFIGSNPLIPGNKKIKDKDLLATAFIDVSGSIADESLIHFLEVLLNTASKKSITIELIQFDVGCVSRDLLTKDVIKNIRKNGFERRASGGTDLGLALKEVLLEDKYDTQKNYNMNTVLVFTDGFLDWKSVEAVLNSSSSNILGHIYWELETTDSSISYDIINKMDISTNYKKQLKLTGEE